MNALAKTLASALAVAGTATACATSPDVLTHGSAERLGASQVATLRAAPGQGTPSTAITLVSERATRTAWPPEAARDRSFSAARVAPGGHEVRVLCTDLQGHRLVLVEVDARAGHFYTLRCETGEVEPGRLGTRVVVTDDGTARRQP